MKRTRILVLAIIILLILLITVVLVYNKIILPKINSAKVEQETSKEPIVNSEDMSDYQWVKLQLMSEKERMKYYVGSFLNFIMERKYDEAYNLLYEEFQNNSFKTLEEFESYAKEKYPISLRVEYTDMQVQGNNHILFLTIKDNLKIGNEFTQIFVVREYDFNDFILSFSVN